MSPVEIFGMRCRAAKRSACVPLPAPGGPKNTRFSGTSFIAVRRAIRGCGSSEGDTERWSIGSSTRVAASKSLDDHFAGFREGFLSMFRKDGQHPAQERILSRAEMVEDVREAFRAELHAARSLCVSCCAVERDAIGRTRHAIES